MYNTKTDARRAAAVLTVLAIFFALGLTADVIAQGNFPQIPDEVVKLQKFLGSWSGTGTMTMGEMQHNLKISHVSEPTADGWGVMTTEINETKGMETYRCMNIFGYDAGGNLTHLYSVSNYGDCHDHKGQWYGENNLKLQYDGVWEGRPMTEKVNIIFDSPRQYRFTVITTQGGEQTMSITGTMKKK